MDKSNYLDEVFFINDGVTAKGQEFIDYWFDPTNPLSKTYHKMEKGIPIINSLRSDLLLHPGSAIYIGKPYNIEEIKRIWEYSVYYNSSFGFIPNKMFYNNNV